MTNIILRAEQQQNIVRNLLLDFADELGRGIWDGKGADAAMRAVQISQELGKVYQILASCDGTDGRPLPSLTCQ